VSIRDLDQGSKMIIFESILTTFKASSVFEAAGTLLKIGLRLKLNHHRQIWLAKISETQCILFEQMILKAKFNCYSLDD
jgi:hypothetical protein